MKRKFLYGLVGISIAVVVTFGFLVVYQPNLFRRYTELSWSGIVAPGNFTVANGVRLTIQPGTVVNLNNCILQVDGMLVARGTDDQKITFNGSYNGKIVFTASSAPWTDSANTGCIMENCKSNCYIICNSSSPKLTHSLLNASDSYNRVLAIDGGAPIVTDNVITGSLHPYRNGLAGDSNILFWDGTGAVITDNVIQKGMFGIAVSFVTEDFSGSPTIKRNLIVDNNEGVTLGAPLKVVFEDNTVTRNRVGVSVSGYSDESVFSGNNIYDNTNSSVQIYKSHWPTNMAAPDNWWGTTGTTAIAQSIIDSYDNPELGTVDFTPVLQVANEDAPNP